MFSVYLPCTHNTFIERRKSVEEPSGLEHISDPEIIPKTDVMVKIIQSKLSLEIFEKYDNILRDSTEDSTKLPPDGFIHRVKYLRTYTGV